MDERLRILFVSHGAALGGSPISCYNLIKGLNPEGFVPLFACREAGPIYSRIEALGTRCFLVERRGIAGCGYMKSYLRILHQENIRVVHLNTLTPYYKYVAIASKLMSIPILWYIREDPSSKRSRNLNFWLNWLADVVVPVSEEIQSKTRVRKRIPSVVVHNGIDIDAFRPLSGSTLRSELGVSRETRIVGTISSFEERKGILYLLEAVPIIKEGAKDFILVLVGEERSVKQLYTRTMLALIDELKLGRDVVILPAREDIVEVINGFDIFVLPSLWEGLSRTVLEAMACGKPVVATDVGGNREQILDGVSGYLVPPMDPKGLAHAVCSLLSNEQLAREMGKNGRKRCKELFTLKRHILSMEKTYQAMVSSRHSDFLRSQT